MAGPYVTAVGTKIFYYTQTTDFLTSDGFCGVGKCKHVWPWMENHRMHER